ncbi:MAG TPA: Gfo/Idh/MocA family oxidoreductase [Gemmatimonadaceae bacterium]|nr:Gfo/Idh/MocA family oxidoreductase [Gemmatimonadaceae bacterium]
MSNDSFSRRDFIKTSAAAAAATAAFGAPAGAWAAPRATIRIGLIGCGGRGKGAANDAVKGSEGIELVAMGDLQPDRLSSARTDLAKALGPAYKVTDAHAFSGFDAYQKVIASDVDLVILATPPGFRPTHIKAVIEAGKHLFTEKPVAVDPVGVRSVLASAELAAQKNLAVVAGTQRRHQIHYLETIKRVHDGAIGDIVGGQVYWNQGPLWSVDRTPEMSDMEWQIRNWLYFTWLSGDHIVEQHVHNIDVANWVMKGHPVRAYGVGGRQTRVEQPKWGHIFDHFCVELEYANGAKVTSMCRQQVGTRGANEENFVGTKGFVNLGDNNQGGRIRGGMEFQRQKLASDTSPYVLEHTDLVASIRAGKPLNELKQVAESVLTAIMAREAAYTGQPITWEQISTSDQDLTPGPMVMGPIAMPPIPMPGVTKLSRGAFTHAKP